MIKVVLFDIGGVLIDYDNQMYYDYLSKTDKINKRLFLKSLDPLDRKIDGGKISRSGLEAKLADELGIQRSRIHYNKAFENVAKTNKEVVKIAEALSKRYMLAILSDINEERYEIVERKFINTKIFSKIFLSYRAHLIKPDRRIFLYVLRGLKVKPKDILFIDNDIRNVRGAKTVGMNSIQFKNVNQLKRDIGKFERKQR
jgi:HAD superfamily hydrolase (TIGR01509 family)